MQNFDLQPIKNYIKKTHKFISNALVTDTPPLFIGFNHPISLKGLTKEEANYLLENDVKKIINELNQKLSWWSTCNFSVQRALINMVFNLGMKALLKFKVTLAFLQKHEYKLAAASALKSKWAAQVKLRAIRVTNLFTTTEQTTALNIAQLMCDLKNDEGFSPLVYRCPSGKWTIGVGRNLVDNGISIEEADYLLHNDLKKINCQLAIIVSNWKKLPLLKQEFLILKYFIIRNYRIMRRTTATHLNLTKKEELIIS